MLTRFLIYIKHNFRFLWSILEFINAFLFKVLHGRKFSRGLKDLLPMENPDGLVFSILKPVHIQPLLDLISRQNPDDLKYFRPHEFDKRSVERMFSNPSFLMMGVFDGDVMSGYFFLRCFWTKKCFVGRLVDEKYRGKNVGRTMNYIMYNLAWKAGFRCLSTISKKNTLVMSAHSKNSKMQIISELDNDYLLVEFIDDKTN